MPSSQIDPELAEGDLVGVVTTQNQAEAEFVQGLLREEGVPSLLRRAPGFDVPDFLAAGPRDVLVPASGAETAREVLLQADLAPDTPASRAEPSALRLLAGVLVAVGLAGTVVWLLSESLG